MANFLFFYFFFGVRYQSLKNAETIFIEGFLVKQTECLSMLCQMFHEYKFFNAPNIFFFFKFYLGSLELFISISIFLLVISFDQK